MYIKKDIPPNDYIQETADRSLCGWCRACPDTGVPLSQASAGGTDRPGPDSEHNRKW